MGIQRPQPPPDKNEESVLRFPLHRRKDRTLRKNWAFLLKTFRHKEQSPEWFTFRYCLEVSVKIIQALRSGKEIYVVSKQTDNPEKIVIEERFISPRSISKDDSKS